MQQAINLQTEALATFKMNVEDGQTQFNTQLLATTKEGAFKHAVNETCAKFQTDIVGGDEIVEEMVGRYPQFFQTQDEAWAWFEKMEEKKIILKKKGKFYLGS